MNEHHSSTSLFLLEQLAQDLRKIAVRASQAAVEAIHRGNVERLFNDPEVDESDASLLVYDPHHAGAAPDRIDARAKEAAWAEWTAGCGRLGIEPRSMIAAGEEIGSGTREIYKGNYLIRQDSCDGTNNARRLWDLFSSVQLIDKVRSVDPLQPRARHLSGAITNNSGITVSWVHTSVFVRSRGRYLSIRGRVYLEGAPWGIPETELQGRRWDRAAGTVAAVAASPERRKKLQEVLDGLSLVPDALYTLGGTPLAPALIGGDLEMLIEPNAVSLHDSALLIPHQILGGVITDLRLKPFDYLGEYERCALTLSPDDKPIEGYIAWGDAAAALGQAGKVS